MRRRSSFTPFAVRGRRMVVAILAIFALLSAVSVAVSIWATSRLQNRATVVEVAARQRTLAERYVNQVLLARAGEQGDPATTTFSRTERARPARGRRGARGRGRRRRDVGVGDP